MESNSDNRLAICETVGGNSVEQTIDQPRQPRNMQDLLRYAIEAESRGAPGTPRNDLGPFDPERRQFLENVITSMTVDVVAELKNALNILRADYKPGDSPEKFEDALEQILDFTDNIDVANDFFKLGGFDVCKEWLEKGPPGVRWRSANVIGECCQNNPLCQATAVEMGLLKMLMDLTLNDCDEMVRVKSFHAVSCIVRNNNESLLTFLSLNGHKLILNCMKSSSYRLKTKASFFTSVIADKEGMLRDQLWDIGLVSELVSSITTSVETKMIEDVACFEQCLSALLCLLKDTNNRIKDGATVSDKLIKLTQILHNNPSYLESVESIQSILKLVESPTKL